MKTLKELCSKFFNILETDSIQSYAEATGDIFCFRRALEKFLNTGRKEDAFTVYFVSAKYSSFSVPDMTIPKTP